MSESANQDMRRRQPQPDICGDKNRVFALSRFDPSTWLPSPDSRLGDNRNNGTRSEPT